jgi:hypothetical protein
MIICGLDTTNPIQPSPFFTQNLDQPLSRILIDAVEVGTIEPEQIRDIASEMFIRLHPVNSMKEALPILEELNQTYPVFTSFINQHKATLAAAEMADKEQEVIKKLETFLKQ